MSEATLYDRPKALDDTVSCSTPRLPSRAQHVAFGNSVITEQFLDNVILVNDRLSLVEHINGNQLIISFRKALNFFTCPFHSSDTNTFHCFEFDVIVANTSLDCVQCKGTLLPHSASFDAQMAQIAQ